MGASQPTISPSAGARTSSSSRRRDVRLGSTGLNAGGFAIQFATAVNIELSKVSFAMMERFADEMDQEIGLRRCGYLFMLDSPADLEQFRRNVAVQNAHGVPSRIVTADEISALAPEVDLTGIIGGTWCPRRRPRRPARPPSGLRVERAPARRNASDRARESKQSSREGTSERVVRTKETIDATRTSSSPRARGRRASATWPASTSRSADPPPNRRHGADPEPAPRFSIRHRLLTLAVLPSRGTGIFTGMSNRDETRGVRHPRRRGLAASPFREGNGATSVARRRGDRRRVGGPVRGDARRSADPGRASGGRWTVRLRRLQRPRVDARPGSRARDGRGDSRRHGPHDRHRPFALGADSPRASTPASTTSSDEHARGPTHRHSYSIAHAAIGR